MGVGDDLAGDPASGRPDDRLIGIGHDDGVLAAEADARPPVPSQFHEPILAQSRCTRITAARMSRAPARQPGVGKKERGRLPNRRPRSEGGRMEPVGVRSETNARPTARSTTTGRPIKKATWNPWGSRLIVPPDAHATIRRDVSATPLRPAAPRSRRRPLRPAVALTVAPRRVRRLDRDAGPVHSRRPRPRARPLRSPSPRRRSRPPPSPTCIRGINQQVQAIRGLPRRRRSSRRSSVPTR